MPRREPIDPEGFYHVSSRGCYGRTLFATVNEHERFLAHFRGLVDLWINDRPAAVP